MITNSFVPIFLIYSFLHSHPTMSDTTIVSILLSQLASSIVLSLWLIFPTFELAED
jgi:hypothetical protein